MLVTWLVVFLCVDFVSSASLTAGLMKRKDENGVLCEVSDRTYQHGAVIAAPTQDDCLSQICNNGQVVTSAQECLDKWISSGVCGTRGSFIFHGCSNFTCDQSNYLVRTRAGCKDDYGACQDVGGEVVYVVKGQVRQCMCLIYNSIATTYACPKNK
ncbi:hypothetical protein BsWGS_03428 [Bradybaena similaris]